MIKANNNDTFLIELQFQSGDDPDDCESVEIVAAIEDRRKLIELSRPDERWVDNDTNMLILKLRLADARRNDD